MTLDPRDGHHARPDDLPGHEAVLPLLGIGPDDLMVYRALLAGASATTVAGAGGTTGLDPARALGALDRLRACGFVVGDSATPPGTALRALVHQRRAENRLMEAELERAAGHIDQVVSDLIGQVPEAVAGQHGSVELLVGAEAVSRCANEIVNTATTELLVFNAPPYAQESIPSALPGTDPAPPPTLDANGEALLRGVRVRTVIAREGVRTPSLMAELPTYLAMGLEVRVRPTIPTKMIVADRRIALLPPTDVADPARSGLVLRDGLLMNLLLPIFEEIWDAALPLGAAVTDEGLGPSDDERKLLDLLASGLKDESIARQLDVPVHTARRRISALLTRLGAETRFQAGIQAARRGWLDPPPGSEA